LKQNKTKQNNPKRGDGHNGPSLTIKNEILVKTTIATSTNKRKKPDENAIATLVSTGIKSSDVKPAPLAPFVKRRHHLKTLQQDELEILML
jgi:hypothetical protein